MSGKKFTESNNLLLHHLNNHTMRGFGLGDHNFRSGLLGWEERGVSLLELWPTLLDAGRLSAKLATAPHCPQAATEFQVTFRPSRWPRIQELLFQRLWACTSAIARTARPGHQDQTAP